MPKASVKRLIECEKKDLIELVLDIEKYPYEENVKIGFGSNKVSKIVRLKQKIKKFLIQQIINFKKNIMI